MAKKEAEQLKNPFDDFNADDTILINGVGGDEDEQEDEDEDEEEEVKPKKEVKPAAKKEKKVERVEDPAPVAEEEEIPDATNPDKEEEEGVDPSQFYEQVEKITGQELAVDYAGVDPLTPQGVALREQAIKSSVLEGFLEEIETKFPAAYKALQHAYNGGDISELFKTATGRDYAKVDIGDKDEVLATEVLKEFYRSKGVKNEAKILRMIEADQDSDQGLVGEARTALAELRAEQETKTNELLEGQKNKAADQAKRDKVMITAIDEVLDSGKISSFKLPSKQEGSDFKRFVVQNIRKLPEGKYEFATPIESGNLEKLLQYQYFQFKKGDLDKLISIKATTKTAEGLKLKLKTEQEKVKSGSGSPIVKLGGSMRDFEI